MSVGGGVEKGGARLSGWSRFAVDFGPLLVFMGGFFLGEKLVAAAGKLAGADWCLREGAEMYVAISLFMPAFAAAFVYSYWRERRVAPMMMISAVIIAAMGALTFALHDKTFFYMKPTLIYALFAALLGGGVATGRNFLKTLFDGALTLPDAAWRTLTVRYAVFFAALAIANEIAWRLLTRDCAIGPTASNAGDFLRSCAAAPLAKCPGEAQWVNLKVFGFTAVNVLFALAQAPFLSKHMSEAATAAASEKPRSGSPQ
jgi:intracellular septation protein